MRDYKAVLKQARTCANRKYCDIGGNCEYYDLDVCCQGGEKDILRDAADAIEEMLGEVERAENRHVVESEMIDEMYAEIERLKAKVPRWMPLPEPPKEVE